MTDNSRIRLIQNAENRFFYDKRRNMIHDRQCTILNSLKVDDLVALDTLTPQYVTGRLLCPKCKRKAAIRNGMRGRLKTSSEQIGYFTDFFSRAGADTCDLERLFIYNEGSVKSVSQDCIEIHVNEDTWRIRDNGEGLTLLHNNYQVKDDYSRLFEKGFHVQGNVNQPSFHSVTESMCLYSFDYHRRKIEAYDRKVRWLHFETGLAIANNYVCCDRRSLLFHYYTFIDIQSKEPSSRKLQGMKVLDRTEKNGYTIITCRIPFWKRTEFEGMMGSLKKKALKERRFEYLDVCESAVPQPA